MGKTEKAYLVESKKTVDIIIDENHLIIRNSSNILHNIPVGNIEQIGLRDIPLPAAEAQNWIALALLARKPKDKGPTLTVTYVGKTGKKIITLVTDKAEELARKIDSLRRVSPQNAPLILSTAPNVPPEEKKYCRYCGFQNHGDAAFCEKCSKKIG